MNIGILGSGAVGQSLGLGFLRNGHTVKIATREPSKLTDWLAKAGANASVGSFEETARFGEMLVLCTKWVGTENAIQLAGKQNFDGKILIDVTNPLLFLQEGKAPKMAVGYPDSAGALVQKWLPKAKVVKAFNSVPAHYMTNPKLEEGMPDLFICGNDEAKKKVTEIAASWGWSSINDMGGIEDAYLLEALAMTWILYGFRNNHWMHAFKLLRK